LSLEGLAIESMPVALEQAKSDLALYLVPLANGFISGMVEYDASLFTETRVAQWAKWFVRTLDQVEALGHTATPVDTLSLINETERQQVLELFNRTQTLELSLDAPSTACATLPELFEQQVARTPEAIALVCGDEQLSYQDLDQRANQLARHLLAQGVQTEDVVPILLDRSVGMIVSMLAVLKAGAAYLPMDPSYPRERLSFMLTDSCASALISTSSLIDETELEALVTVVSAAAPVSVVPLVVLRVNNEY
jgi:non-ribosomal peptide synthetase component F